MDACLKTLRYEAECCHSAGQIWSKSSCYDWFWVTMPIKEARVVSWDAWECGLFFQPSWMCRGYISLGLADVVQMKLLLHILSHRSQGDHHGCLRLMVMWPFVWVASSMNLCLFPLNRAAMVKMKLFWLISSWRANKRREEDHCGRLRWVAVWSLVWVPSRISQRFFHWFSWIWSTLSCFHQFRVNEPRKEARETMIVSWDAWLLFEDPPGWAIVFFARLGICGPNEAD